MCADMCTNTLVRPIIVRSEKEKSVPRTANSFWTGWAGVKGPGPTRNCDEKALLCSVTVSAPVSCGPVYPTTTMEIRKNKGTCMLVDVPASCSAVYPTHHMYMPVHGHEHRHK